MDWRETPPTLERARAEHPVVIPGPRGHMFGIVTPASPHVQAAGKCVVLLGRNRWQRDRMAVDGARWLAARGFTCLRFDYHGYGESEGPSAIAYSYQPWRSQVVAAIRFMRKAMGEDRFVLAGLCFDGLTALSAFEDEADAIDGIVLIAAPVFADTSQPIAFRFAGTTRTLSDKLRAVRAMTTVERRRLIALSLRRYTQGTLRTMRKARYALAGDERTKLAASFRKGFYALTRSSARALFLYGEDDDEYREFRVAERLLFPALDPKTRARLEVEVRPGRVHPPALTGVQRSTLARTVEWISAMNPATLEEPSIASPLAASNQY